MADFRLIEYAPIGLMFVVAGGFAASQLLVTQLIGPRKRTQTKLMPYECGKDPVGSAHDRFSIKFYSVAVDFLLFDLEVLFLIPFAVAFKSLIELENLSKGPPWPVWLLQPERRLTRPSRWCRCSYFWRWWLSGLSMPGKKAPSIGTCRPVPEASAEAKEMVLRT